MNFEEGEIISIDKDLDWTSFDVVKKIRGALRIKKIGHAGTLDPLATGLLILCTGKKTKTIHQFMDAEKEYTGELILGKTTPSYDLETETDSETDISDIDMDSIYTATQKFTGAIMQKPPIYSAIRIKGKRSYDLARKGKEVVLEARPITIDTFEITKIELPKVSFRVVCSKGTYIRSLIHDFGQELGVGAYLSALRRTRIGEYSVDNAHNVEEFINQIKEA